MKKQILSIAGLVFISIKTCVCQTAFLDKDFGDEGKVITGFRNYDSHCNAIDVQPDGKILAAGYKDYAALSDFIILRYNINGSIDTEFGEDGIVYTDFGSVNEFAEAISVQQDGKIIVAGNTNGFFAMARYNNNGTIDSLFGDNGKVITYITDHGYYKCGSVAVRQDEKILLAGSTGYDGALLRYNSDGSPDSSFGEEGIVIVNFGNLGDEYVFVSMAVQKDHKIVVAGFSYVEDYDFTVMRFYEDGKPDSLFGENGKVTADIFNSPDDRATSLTLQQDGKIIVAGWSGAFSMERTDWDFGIIRFNTDGTPDNSFGNEGRVLADLNNLWDDRPESVAMQPDGKILVAGYSYTVGYSDYALVRFNTDGTPDTTFGINGIVISDIAGSSYDYGKALHVQDDGKILVAGTSDNNIAVIRYLPELVMSYKDFSNACNNLIVYPVPIDREAIFNYTLNRDEIISVNLYDNTGKMIQNFINRKKRYDGQNQEILIFDKSITSGYYVLELGTPDKKAGIRIIKR